MYKYDFPPYNFPDCIFTVLFQKILSILPCPGSPNTKATSISRFFRVYLYGWQYRL